MNASSLGLAFFVGVATITGCAANGYAKRLNPDTSHVPPSVVMRRAGAPLMVAEQNAAPQRFASAASGNGTIDKGHMPQWGSGGYSTANMAKPDTIANATSSDAPEVRILAALAYGEARNQGRKGMVAIMHVALNRLDSGKWGDTLEDVVFAPKQFSAFNAGDVNLRLIARMALTDGDKDWQRCKDVARRVLAGEIKDPTAGSLFYHEQSISPAWSRKMKRVARIGKHVFWKG